LPKLIRKMKKPLNYYFEVVTPERAKQLYKEGKKELFKIFDDSEARIESEHDLHDAIDLAIELAVENPIL